MLKEKGEKTLNGSLDTTGEKINKFWKTISKEITLIPSLGKDGKYHNLLQEGILTLIWKPDKTAQKSKPSDVICNRAKALIKHG